MLQAVRCARLTVAQGPLEQQGSGDLEGGQPIRRGGRPFDRSPRRPRKRLYRDGGDPWIAGLVGSLQGAQGDPERMLVVDRQVEIGHPSHQASKRSEEHTSELQSLMRISYAVFCLKKKINTTKDILQCSNNPTDDQQN